MLPTDLAFEGSGVVPAVGLAEHQLTVSQHYSQVLLLSGEGVRQVLDVLCLVFLHMRMERLQDLTDQRGDLLGDAARLLDFVNLQQNICETKQLERPNFLLPRKTETIFPVKPVDNRSITSLPRSENRELTFFVGIFSFISSASRQRTFQGAWIFKKPTP